MRLITPDKKISTGNAVCRYTTVNNLPRNLAYEIADKMLKKWLFAHCFTFSSRRALVKMKPETSLFSIPYQGIENMFSESQIFKQAKVSKNHFFYKYRMQTYDSVPIPNNHLYIYLFLFYSKSYIFY